MSKVLYTSDIHGNKIQYKKLIDYAVKIAADFIIVGGDIAPKNFLADQFIIGQREFFERELPELVSPLKNKLPGAKLFLMMGNDDAVVNMDALEKYDQDLYYIIHERRTELADGFDLVGYSFVSITPFKIKDWEKFDFSRVPAEMETRYNARKRMNYNFSGVKSTPFGWEDFKFTSKIERKDAIQNDLEKECFLKNPEKTVFIFHCPPNDTNLDIISSRLHVGSMAIRRFIETYHPYLTLHGHIHETVRISGDFKHEIGKTLCLSSGNHNEGDDLAVLVFNLGDIREVRRIII